MKYSLLIYINEQWQELDITEEPAITYQGNTITDLADRKATYSQSFALPKSAHNCRVLGFIDTYQIQTSVPYNVYPCRLYCEGLAILNDEYVIRITAQSDVITAEIVSGIKDFFAYMNKQQITKYSFGTIFSWTPSDIFALHDDDYYEYMLFDPTPKGNTLRYVERSTSSPGGDYVRQSFIKPVAKLRKLLERIIEVEGYTLQTDLFDSPNYEEYYVSLANFLSKSDANFTNWLSSGTANITTFPKQDTPFFVDWSASSASWSGGYYNLEAAQLTANISESGEPGELYKGMLLSAPDKITVNVFMRAIVSANNGCYVYARLMLFRIIPKGINANNLQPEYRSINIENISGDIGAGHTDRLLYGGDATPKEITLNEGEKLFMVWRFGDTVDPTEGNTPMSITCAFNISVPQEANEFIIPGYAGISLNRCLGFESAGELLQTWIQMFNLQVSVDTQTKVLSLYTFDKLLAEKENALDWSDKLNVVKGTYEITYALDGYTQQNLLLFEKDEEGLQVWGIINVNNSGLQTVQDLLTLMFESGEDGQITTTDASGAIITQHTVAKLNDFDPDDYIQDSYNAFNFRGSGTHLLKRGDIQQTYYNAYRFGNPIGNMFVGYAGLHVQPTELISKYFQSFIDNVLTDSFVVEAKMLLTPLDIKQLDLFVPVKIQYFGKTFYISKINNYIANQLRNVTLIKF